MIDMLQVNCKLTQWIRCYKFTWHVPSNSHDIHKQHLFSALYYFILICTFTFSHEHIKRTLCGVLISFAFNWPWTVLSLSRSTEMKTWPERQLVRGRWRHRDPKTSLIDYKLIAAAILRRSSEGAFTLVIPVIAPDVADGANLFRRKKFTICPFTFKIDLMLSTIF